jgi:hypothetical protein
LGSAVQILRDAPANHAGLSCRAEISGNLAGFPTCARADADRQV